MTSGIQHRYGKYNHYILFLILSLCLFYIFNPIDGNWHLTQIKRGIISEATIHAVDIKSRKSTFILLNFSYLLLASIIYLIFKKKKSLIHIRVSPIKNSFIWPALLSVISYFFFAGTPYTFYPDLFESANPTLCIDRLSNHQIPFINYLSSHMLSEQIIPVMHNITHTEAGPMEWISWKGAILSINLVILFILFRKWFESPLISILILLIYPFTQWVIPKEFVIGLIPLLFIKPNMENRQNFMLISILLLGVLWKLDSGIAGIGATTFIFFYLAINRSLNYRGLIFSIGTILLIIGLTFLIIWKTYPPLLDNFHLALDYFSSDQAHGRMVLTNWPKDFQFKFHHYLFPFLSVLILLITMFSKKQDFISFSLIYSVPFYLFNFQRGLVRHSFTSGTDVHLSSLVYLIFGLFAISLIMPYVNKNAKVTGQNRSIQLSLIFILSTSVTILLFKPGNYFNKESYLHSGIKNVRSLIKDGSIKKEWTKERDEYLEKNVEPFQKYLDSHFKKDQTFFDFSNHPLLYHLTGRTNPSYFNQFLQNVATVRQQEIIIDQLKDFDIPIVLYSYHPKEWLDMTDNVPNALRYHLVHQYIKENYTPLGMVNNKILWLRNDLPVDQYAAGTQPIPCQPIDLYAGYLPQLLTTYNYNATGYTIKEDTIPEGITSYKNKGMPGLRITGNFQDTSNLLSIYTSDCHHTIKFKTFGDKSTYIIPLYYLPMLPNKVNLDGLGGKNKRSELIYLEIED
jgi:hypothetical protein